MEMEMSCVGPSLRGTKTETNLLTTFASESQASNRYLFAAKVAKEEGYAAVSRELETLALQKQQQAKRIFSLLKGGVAEVAASYTDKMNGNTVSMLKGFFDGEQHKLNTLYPQYKTSADSEGLPEIAKCFVYMLMSEEGYLQRLRKLIDQCENDYFISEEPVMWRCLRCGYVHIGIKAPSSCPLCVASQGMYERLEYGVKLPQRRENCNEEIESKK